MTRTRRYHSCQGHHTQTAFAVHEVSHPIFTRCSSAWVKTDRTWIWPLTTYCRGYECTESFSSPPYVELSWCLDTGTSLHTVLIAGASYWIIHLASVIQFTPSHCISPKLILILSSFRLLSLLNNFILQQFPMKTYAFLLSPKRVISPAHNNIIINSLTKSGSYMYRLL
jgi:hypothetical protein